MDIFESDNFFLEKFHDVVNVPPKYITELVRPYVTFESETPFGSICLMNSL